MNSAELIVALHADSNSELGKNIRLIEQEMPNMMDELSDKLINREYSDLLITIRGAAGEIRAMGTLSFTY